MRRHLLLALCVLVGWPLAAHAQTTLLSDTFTDSPGTALGSHTMNTGSGWTVPSGAFQVGASNQAVGVTDDTSNIAIADAGQADVTVSVDIFVPPTAQAWGLIFRYVDTSNYWQLAMVNGTLELDEIVAGTPTTRDTEVTGGSLDSTTVSFSVVLSGSSITATVGAYNLSYSSSTHATATKFGMLNYLNAAGSYVPAPLDNFLVTGAGGGGGTGCSMLLCGAGQ